MELAFVAWKRFRVGGPEAVEDLLSIQAVDEDSAPLWLDLARRCREAGDVAGTMQCLDRVRPADRTGLEQFAALSAWCGRFDDALAARRAILDRHPDDPAALLEMGVCLVAANRPGEALAFFRRAVAAKPDWPRARVNLAMALLAVGEYREGWRQYEWRDRLIDLGAFEGAGDCRRWAGEPLDGRMLLVSGEQGFGDNIQFSRFLPRLEGLGGAVAVAVRPPLARLLRFSFPALAVVTAGDSLRRPDLSIPLLSLPSALGLGAAEVGMTAPYLKVPSEMVGGWQRRLAAAAAGRPVVGVAWRSAGAAANSAEKSIPLAALAPLIEAAGFPISLQKDVLPAEREAMDSLGILDFSTDLSDFADTAALVGAVDHVVAVDTAALHLAGALARPAVALLPFAPDWRWQGGDPSPWYPSIRSVRQPRPHHWEPAVAAALALLRSQNRHGRR